MQHSGINSFTRVAGIMVLALAGWLGGCAHDANTGLDIVPYPNEAKIVWSVRGNQYSPDFWYYTVFNFSKSPSTSAVNQPLDVISNELRGLNWELFVGFHPDSGGTEIFTKQIPRGPTVIGTADGPTCTATFDADGNNFGDIVVTCADGGVTQLIRSVATQIDQLEPIYFLPIETISTGVRPFRCHDYDLDADGNRDVAVLDAGNDTTAPFIRVLQGNGNAEFTALADQPLGVDVLVDSIMDEFNGDAVDDLALITESGGVRQAVILLGNVDGTFTAQSPLTIGPTALSLQCGEILNGTKNLAIAETGTAADGLVRVLEVAIDGSLSAGLELAVPGSCFSASIGNMFGSNNDVLACWENADGTGSAGTWITDNDGLTADTPVSFSTGNNVPTYCLAHETGNNSNTDAVLVTGDPDDLDQTLFIREGGRFVPDTGSISSEFAWVNDIITYLTGLQPTRIEVAPVDDLSVEELIVPHSSLDEGGSSVSIFYGLGKNNYTTAERYWTDSLPDILGSTTQWYVSHQMTTNAFALTIDPNVFYDLAEQRRRTSPCSSSPATAASTCLTTRTSSGSCWTSSTIPWPSRWRSASSPTSRSIRLPTRMCTPWRRPISMTGRSRSTRLSCFQRLANFVLVLVVIALVAVLALNYYLMPQVDEELADSVRREFMLPPSSTVLITRGSLLDTIEGQVDSFYVDSSEAKLDGMIVEDLQFRASGISFDITQVLLSGNAGLKEVRSGELELKVSEDALVDRWGRELEKRGMRDVSIELTDGQVRIDAIFDMAFAEMRIGALGRIVADGSTRLRLQVDELQLGGTEVGVKELKAAFSALTPVVDLDQFRVAIEVDKLEMHDGYLHVQARSRTLDELETQGSTAPSEIDAREQELLDELEKLRREKEASETDGQVSEDPAPDYIPDETEPDEKDMNSLGGEA